jgi:uncharacterized protein YjiS (DUF1127 family)
MTFATLTRSSAPDLSASLSESIYHMIQRFEDYRQYRRTVAELRDLSTAQLADMGVSRSDIIRVSREAVYGPGA